MNATFAQNFTASVVVSLLKFVAPESIENFVKKQIFPAIIAVMGVKKK